MRDEAARFIERTRHREITPQPHWRTPEDMRRTAEVTQPSVRLEDFGLASTSEGLDQETDPGLDQSSDAFATIEETRRTAEFDADPFRQFARSGRVVGDDGDIETNERLDHEARRRDRPSPLEGVHKASTHFPTSASQRIDIAAGADASRVRPGRSVHKRAHSRSTPSTTPSSRRTRFASSKANGRAFSFQRHRPSPTAPTPLSPCSDSVPC